MRGEIAVDGAFGHAVTLLSAGGFGLISALVWLILEKAMTNEELLQDLKQLITATISQQMANVATKDDLRDLRREVKTDLKEVEQRLTARIDGLEAKIDRVQDAVADTLTRVAE
ncbi:MAG TPA: hypothetical protein VF444_19330, partial [Pseudonocardiaceae bacterium]